MSADFCRRCSKKLEYTGEFLECRHCGYRTTPAAAPMTQPEVRDLVRKVRALKAPLSGSCLGRFHRKCQVSTCPCWCHSPEARQRYAAHLRRAAADMEHQSTRTFGGPVPEEVAARAEELRRRADEVTP